MPQKYDQRNYQNFLLNILVKMWSMLLLEERWNLTKTMIGITLFENLCIALEILSSTYFIRKWQSKIIIKLPRNGTWKTKFWLH